MSLADGRSRKDGELVPFTIETELTGRMLCSQKVTLILRLIDLGLLARTDAATILPGMTIPSTEPGESVAVSCL